MSVHLEFFKRTAEAAIPSFSIVKPGAAAGGAVVAAAATDKLLGTTDGVLTNITALDKVSGELIDVGMDSIHYVRLGGTVADGDYLTSNGTGAAITTITAANQVIGRALAAGVSGDVIPYRVSLGQL